ELGNQYADYAELQSHESFKYVPSATSVTHQQEPQNYESDAHGNFQSIDAGPHQNSQQYQHQVHQQEILVGNQLQSLQQKVAKQKYVDPGEDREIFYINIPMSQLLAYQNYATKQPGHNIGEQQVSIPVYMPTAIQKLLYASIKNTPQPDYQIGHQTPAQMMFAEGQTHPSPTHATPVAAHMAAPSQQHYSAEPTYASPVSQQPKYQYYVLSQQHQQQPSIDQNSVAHVDIYNMPETPYVNDNSLHEQIQQAPQQYIHGQTLHRYNDATAVAERLMAQILQQLGVPYVGEFPEHNIKGQDDYVPRHQQLQKFHGSSDNTHLVPVSAVSNGFSSKPVHSPRSQKPKTLLDSYIPSRVIAALDAERYTERPIKLEGGFLPSKINFIHSYKKRQSE
ncbi:hypothetical protein QAD02_008684, partial [Eretmocerus hayati]